MIKKILSSLLLIPVLVVTLSATARAVDVIDPVCENVSSGQTSAVCKDNQITQGADDSLIFGPTGIGSKIVNIFSIIGGIAAVIVILIASVRFITSSGDPNSVTAARNAIIGAVVGLVVIGLSQVTVRFVLSRV